MKPRQLLLGIIVFLLLQGVAFSQNFVELWNNFAYYDTNLEKKGFASILGRFEGKIGVHLFNSPLQAYGVYYGVTSQSEDYWDNFLFSGIGIRFRPFERYQSSNWTNEWIRNVKLYYENLSSNYLKDKASAEAANLAKTDIQYGIDIWHEWNLDKPNESILWGELWSKLSFRSTNFSSSDFNSYIFYFQPKVGKHLGQGVETYLRLDLTYSGKDDYWLNIADYGVGIRIEPWRKSGGEKDLFTKFKMFAEVLGVSYLKNKPTDSNKEVSSDVRFGIDFSYGR